MLAGILINFLVKAKEIIKTGEKTLTSQAQQRRREPQKEGLGDVEREKERDSK